MRSTCIALLLGCYIALALGSLHSLESHNSLGHKLKQRIPLIRPEQPTILQDSKRSKREPIPLQLQEFQDFLTKYKESCAKELNMPLDEVLEKSLLYETNPTPKEKCLIECILKRSELMDSNNRLSTQRIALIADLVSDKNPLVSSIAMAAAEHCNKFINASQPCEAADQINRCISNEMKMRKVKIFY